ncbi:MAG: GntR family transcriptional regulator [Pseudomonadota bacterium]
MQNMVHTIERRTTTDVVYEALYEEIATLKLLPGAKLSETDVARRFSVSRQPVRDAFNRLESKQLLLIRPQKATVVRGFSMQQIANARFVRLAVELEVLRAACGIWNADRAAELRGNLDQQQAAVADGDGVAFHSLDYLFHKMICELGGHPLVFATIEDCKRSIDRLCVLSLNRKDEAAILAQDHENIASALQDGDADRATHHARLHFARLDETIRSIHREHANYFDEAS